MCLSFPNLGKEVRDCGRKEIWLEGHNGCRARVVILGNQSASGACLTPLIGREVSVAFTSDNAPPTPLESFRSAASRALIHVEHLGIVCFCHVAY